MMKSLSVGVSSTGCLVNSLSKLEVSRLSFCQTESTELNWETRGAGAGQRWAPLRDWEQMGAEAEVPCTRPQPLCNKTKHHGRGQRSGCPACPDTQPEGGGQEGAPEALRENSGSSRHAHPALHSHPQGGAWRKQHASRWK